MAVEPAPKYVETSPDPWQIYGATTSSKGKGKGVVPEASTYGLFFVGIALLFVLLARFDRDKPAPSSANSREVRWDDPPSSCDGSSICGWVLAVGIALILLVVVAAAVRS